METEHWLSKYLDELDEKGKYLECDGLTQVISMILFECDIKHDIHVGSIQAMFGAIIPHLWVELEDGYIIDYRARIWLGDREEVLHGIFKTVNYTEVDYNTSDKVKFNPQTIQMGKLLAGLEGIDYNKIISSIKENK